MDLIRRRRFRITPRVLAFAAVAAALVAIAAWVIIQAGTYNPDLPSNCVNKRDPDPLFPIPAIVVGAVIAFLAGGVAARLRARFGGSK